jgi:hypothetical protein
MLQQARTSARLHLLFPVKEGMVDVRPELSQDERRVVQGDIHQPALACFCPCALLPRIIKVRNSRSCARSDDLRCIDGFSSRVRSCNQSSGKRIGQAFHESPVPQRVVAPILVQNGGEKEFNHIVFIRLVGKRVPIIAAMAGHSLMKLRDGIRRLADGGQRPTKTKAE